MRTKGDEKREDERLELESREWEYECRLVHEHDAVELDEIDRVIGSDFIPSLELHGICLAASNS
jgi:hypothetical protein